MTTESGTTITQYWQAVRNASEQKRIALELPSVPESVEFPSSEGSLQTIYSAATLEEAKTLYSRFALLPYAIARNDKYTLIDQWACIQGVNSRVAKPYHLDFYSDGAPYFECSALPSMAESSLCFFTHVAGHNMRVSIRIADCPVKVGITPQFTPSGYRYIKDHPHVPGASIIRWGGGEGICKATYWFRTLAAFNEAMQKYVKQ